MREQPPSAVRRSELRFSCVGPNNVELRSTWTAEGGCPHVAGGSFRTSEGARAYISEQFFLAAEISE